MNELGLRKVELVGFCDNGSITALSSEVGFLAVNGMIRSCCWSTVDNMTINFGYTSTASGRSMDLSLWPFPTFIRLLVDSGFG